MLGGLDPIPLIGEDFQKLFPATLLLLVAFNAFDVWSKLMLCLGLEDFQFAEVIDAVKIEEGKTLARIGKQNKARVIILERGEREREIKFAMNSGGDPHDELKVNSWRMFSSSQ